MTGTKWRDLREKRITNKQPCERLDNIESFDEIYNPRCLNWFTKLTIMPATESENLIAHQIQYSNGKSTVRADCKHVSS